MTEQKKPRKIKTWAERKDAVMPDVQRALDANDMEALEECMPPLQLAFANEYIKHFNGAQAVRDCGSTTKYPEKLAFQWLSNPGIKAIIKYLLEERTQRMKVDQGYVVQKLLRTVEAAEKQENHQAVLRAVELLAKHLGMFSDKIELTGKDGGAIQMEKMNEDAAALERAIAGLAKRSGKEGVAEPTKH